MTDVPKQREVPAEIVAAISIALLILRRREEAPQPPQTTVLTLPPQPSAWRLAGRLP